MKLYVVTDPMCSWCWGMSAAVEEAAHQLAGQVEFDLLLGGINVHGTQPIGDFGRRHLLKIWAEVHAVTGQPFGFSLPDDFVYNSTLPCIAIEALRERSGRPPFGYLHRLQQALFVSGWNINDARVLAQLAEEFGWQQQELLERLDDPTLVARVEAQFARSREYGTNALPNVLLEDAGARSLLVGGYADSATLRAMIEARLTG